MIIMGMPLNMKLLLICIFLLIVIQDIREMVIDNKKDTEQRS